MMIVAYTVAVLLPLFFLYLIYAQDLYGQGKFGYVVMAFGWGLVAFGGAYGINLLAGNHLLPQFGLDPRSAAGYMAVVVFVAPIVEEIVKSLVLVGFLSRRMTYFVDGAIYGFAAGIGFSILENLVIYLPQSRSAQEAGLLAVIRTLSTCLMHGSSSALVGAAIGRFRYGHGWRRFLSTIAGWVLAIGLHMGFNRLANASPGFGVLLGALGIGIGGAGLIVIFIRWGLAEEKRWMEETLSLGVGVTKKEVAVVQRFEQIDELLQPILDRFGFGEDKVEQVESFLLKQAQLGIKRKTRSLSQDSRERERLSGEIAVLQEDMERIRSQVGWHCMVYVRSIFPPEALIDWAAIKLKMVDREAFQAAGGRALDEDLAGRVVEQQQPSGLWGRMGQQMTSDKAEEE